MRIFAILIQNIEGDNELYYYNPKKQRGTQLY
jgi:hypothetical protein